MNRPERLNALGGNLTALRDEALEDFNADPNMHVGIVTGTGRAFSAGADLKEMAERNAAGTNSPRRGGLHERPGLLRQPEALHRGRQRRRDRWRHGDRRREGRPGRLRREARPGLDRRLTHHPVSNHRRRRSPIEVAGAVCLWRLGHVDVELHLCEVWRHHEPRLGDGLDLAGSDARSDLA